ncbi:sugar phosphate isomerase/epimerase [Halobacteria archaeon AArc-m2/3/4]|uniref:Sugar phosphate isomerase/epimerase n=1 Tax=Natronoglomus mannanivorans TaxID=2979990 RepID=A0ABT2QFV3_9EURY|nr:sugar phosphate isomerase/epimerase [Halobacteria archaeon AArc-m2/3/4]
MVQTAIQLFTLADVDEPLPDIVARVGETTFDAVEFYDAHFDALADDETRSQTHTALEDGDLEVAGAHVSVDRLESGFEELVSICHEIGCSTLVIPTYEPEAFATREGVEGAADRIAGLAADLESHDIELLYHNHTFEFGSVDSEVAFERFVDHADGRFGFEPDVGLATHAGYDALELLEQVAGAAPIVHLTDTVPGEDEKLHADVGEGVVDIEACADRAAANGADWIVCENGRTTDALASLEHGSEAFAELRERASN